MTKAGRVSDYLGHILEAIQRIERYTADMDEVGFLGSSLIQDAVIRNLEIIGEASNSIQRVEPRFAEEHKHIPWAVMYALRNRLSHGYDKLDFELIWKTIQRDLPELHAQIADLTQLVRAPPPGN
jgi:uncharacterized protein with HEPN domain